MEKNMMVGIAGFDSMEVVHFQRKVVFEEDMVVGSSSVLAASLANQKDAYIGDAGQPYLPEHAYLVYLEARQVYLEICLDSVEGGSSDSVHRQARMAHVGGEGEDVDWRRIHFWGADILEVEHIVGDIVGMVRFDRGEVDVLVHRVAPTSNRRQDGMVLAGVEKAKVHLVHCFQFSGDSSGKCSVREAAQLSSEK